MTIRRVIDVNGRSILIDDAPAGGGATNLTATVGASAVTINSDTGTDAIIPAATGALSGVLTAADKTKLDAITGTNTGNQTTIVGITGTLAEFNAALTGSDFATGGGTATGTNTGDQDLSSYATTAAVAAGYQPLDTQLTSLAGLAYTANALKVVRVNAAETGFEVATASAGSASITATSVTLPYAARSTVTVTDATVTATSKILIGWGNSLDTDTNDCEMDAVTFKVKAAAGSFALTVSSLRNIIGGVFKLNYQVAA